LPRTSLRKTTLVRVFFIALGLTLAAGHSSYAQNGGLPPASTAGRPQPSTPVTAANLMQAHGQLLLVLPFDNAGSDASVDWIGTAFPEIFDRRFASAGFLPISRGDRSFALEHLGLPADFRPTRASTLRLAQTLDADYVIIGSFTVDGTRITASAHVIDIENLRESPAVVESSDLSHLADVANALAWRITRQLDPSYSVAEQTFQAADANIRLDALEDYIRGEVQGTAQERIQHLSLAVQLDPNYSQAWLALGIAYFAQQHYDEAAIAFGHLKSTDTDALQADFYRGLSFFYTGKYLQAEDAFAFVTARLPLPEVVNDEGVAAARRGKDAAPLFQQAITEDPRDADYHFNLALAYAHRSDAVNALKEAQQALAIHPNDSEIQALVSNLRSPDFLKPKPAAVQATPQVATQPANSPAGTAPSPRSPDLPLERIKRSYSEAAFRQAAFEMEQMETLRAASESPAKRMAKLLANADQYLNAGLLVESEREYNRALAADASSADAYAGLARIRERTGNHAAAAQMANRSIQLRDNPAAHLVLARLALLANQVPQASQEVQAALRLDPNNADARGLRLAVNARGGQLP
jgi:tetratricopeptide (TPR) repeat protein